MKAVQHAFLGQAHNIHSGKLIKSFPAKSEFLSPDGSSGRML